MSRVARDPAKESSGKSASGSPPLREGGSQDALDLLRPVRGEGGVRGLARRGEPVGVHLPAGDVEQVAGLAGAQDAGGERGLRSGSRIRRSWEMYAWSVPVALEGARRPTGGR
nr:hypothetical protein GCM10020093_100250 [Planobispora longispora]